MFNVIALQKLTKDYTVRKDGGRIPYVLRRSQFPAGLLPLMKSEICGSETEPGTKIRSMTGAC